MAIKKNCKICKKEFILSISIYGGGGRAKTCSVECSNINRRENVYKSFRKINKKKKKTIVGGK